MIQPDGGRPATPLEPHSPAVGCAGRITSFAETGDGRYLITLTGIARFRVERGGRRRRGLPPCRVTAAFRGRLRARRRDRSTGRRCSALRAYLDAHDLEPTGRASGGVERDARQRACHDGPFGPEEKQALLEAPDLKSRAETLVALTEIELARAPRRQRPEPTLQ